ncbi:hypothetical protein PPTG_03428 [Phytophthora nicotianae INRA-310]|uniref:BZIP domain-containing protein n=1 Tax=Phytophthora nicotianae (strain INRA-310) TaxID=761204 RepID=W2R6T7_PHYN3|nr:hypothetical protein PPTG_03428 [Phytophthora nicotianae INRA-310]ETN20414.1 hypothetical protein PPTG_03428 [Phytophthora nicotianae INRA-310]
MATDLEFLDQVTAFLETETLVRGLTPRKSLQNDAFQHHGFPSSWRASFPPPPINDFEEENSSSSSAEARVPTKRNKRSIDAAELSRRRQKYRQRQKTTHEELRRQEQDLSKQVQDILDARAGAKTTARTDLALAKSFWKRVAQYQRDLRLQVEAEKNGLAAMVNAQAAYIESMGVVTRERPSLTSSSTWVSIPRSVVYDKVDDRKWLRLKSSDTALYEAYLQDLYDSHGRVDKVLNECGIDSLPVNTISSLHRHNPDGGVEYVQLVNKFLQPFSFEDTCSSLWKIADLPYRHIDREVFRDIPDSDNTVVVKFRVKKMLSKDTSVSILKRVVARRFDHEDRVVMIWKVFWEGEGIFSGMDIDETAWVCIRPYSDDSHIGAMTETCTRQVPVQYLTSRKKDPTVQAFWKMTHEVNEEEKKKIVRFQA